MKKIRKLHESWVPHPLVLAVRLCLRSRPIRCH